MNTPPASNQNRLLQCFAISFRPILTGLAISLLAVLLGGCNTLGTLASQISETPLPPRIAAKLYGVCRDCHTHGILPGCEKCIVVQQYRRKFAGMSASQVTSAMAAEAQNAGPATFHLPWMRKEPPLQQAIWIREEPKATRRKPVSTSFDSPKPGPDPSLNAPENSRPIKTSTPPSPYPTPSSPRKPDIFDALGYGDN